MEPICEPLTIPAYLSQIASVVDWMSGACRALALSDDRRQAMRLCLEEALANVALHAYPSDEAFQEVSVTAWLRPDALVLVIEDQGIPFDPTTAVSPAINRDIDGCTIGGRGILLMRAYADALEYARTPAGNRLSLSFGLGVGPKAERQAGNVV